MGGFYRVVILAFVDCDNQFLAVDVGVQGRINDKDVFRNLTMYFTLEDDKLNLHHPARLAVTKNTEQDATSSSIPDVFVSHDTFQLTY